VRERKLDPTERTRRFRVPHVARTARTGNEVIHAAVSSHEFPPSIPPCSAMPGLYLREPHLRLVARLWTHDSKGRCGQGARLQGHVACQERVAPVAVVSEVPLCSHKTCPETSEAEGVAVMVLIVSKVKDSAGCCTVIEST
jgi:hypothetical protein